MYIKPAYIYILLLVVSSTIYFLKEIKKENSLYNRFRKYAYLVFGYGFAFGLILDQYFFEDILIPYFIILMAIVLVIATFSEKSYYRLINKK
ncbi:hypothetical protein ACFSCX_23370 [Bacillus salitolerans]|uniref:Uncharacterized protein n=1 Tax=Bacillus salitolerans TaxID=1437434 RepID=A0ABW4LWA1_9BACI